MNPQKIKLSLTMLMNARVAAKSARLPNIEHEAENFTHQVR